MAEVAFRYSVIADESMRVRARQHAHEIRLMTLGDGPAAVAIGQCLAAVRADLSPALFQLWVELEFGWQKAAVSNYLQAAAVFAGADALDRFRLASLYALARPHVPRSVVDQALSLAREGTVITPKVVGQLLREAGIGPAHPSAGRSRKPRQSLLVLQSAVIQMQTCEDICRAVDLIFNHASLVWNFFPTTVREECCGWCLSMTFALREGLPFSRCSFPGK